MKYGIMHYCMLLGLVSMTLADTNQTTGQDCTPNTTSTQCCALPKVIVNNTCVDCGITNCAKCTIYGDCEQCKSGYVVANNSQLCQQVQGNQTGCREGEQAVNGTCYSKCSMRMCRGCLVKIQPNTSEYLECSSCSNASAGSCSCLSPNIGVNASTCIQCMVDGCATCSQTNTSKCAQCKHGYSLQQNDTLCVEDEQHCNGTREYLRNGTCQQCGIQNCNKCASNSTHLQYCQECEYSYQIVANSSRTACEFKCGEGQSYYNSTCTDCQVNNCQICNKFNPHLCSKCKYSNTTVSAQTATCPSNDTQIGDCQGSIPYCKSCFINGNNSTRICLACHDPYLLVPNSDNTTRCRVPTCAANMLFLNGKCSCYPGYYLSPTNKCESCMNYCQNCTNSSTCTICYTGYFYNNSICNTCGPNCQSCTSSASCQVCKPGYRLMGVGASSNCQPMPTQITGLTSATINANPQTIVCEYGCSGCALESSGLSCSSCIMGRYLLNTGINDVKICMPCPYGCSICVNATYCTQCYSRYSLNSTNLCSTCVQPNCLSCIGSYCSMCELGYRLTPANECTKCPSRCLVCNNNECLQCQNGLVGFNGECLECVSGCSACSTSNISICTSCNNGYYLNNASHMCTRCGQGCRKCDETGCLQCQIEYLINKQGMCVKGCGALCGECMLINDPRDPAKSLYNCTKCVYGYTMLNSACIPKPYPLINGICKLADYWNGSTCLLCNISDTHCITCERLSNQLVCTRCDARYALSGRSCVLCQVGCQNCYSKDYCINCQNGYFLEQVMGSSTGKCVACSSTHHCKTCMYSTSQCTSCTDGYIFEGFKCISLINIGVKLHLDEAPTAMILMLDDLKSQLIASVKSSLRDQTQYVTINSFQEGSTIIGMNMSVPEGVSPVQAAYNMHYYINSNDFPYHLKSSPQINYNNYQPETREQQKFIWGNRTVGIIIACIFGLLLIAVIFLFMRMRKRQIDQQAAAPPPRNQNDIELPQGTGQQFQEKEKSQLFDIQ